MFCKVKGAGDADGVYKRVREGRWVMQFEEDEEIHLCSEEEFGRNMWLLKMPLDFHDEVVIGFIESDATNPFEIEGSWKVSTGGRHETQDVEITRHYIPPDPVERTMKFTFQFLDPQIFIPTRTNSNRFLMLRCAEIDVNLPQSYFVDFKVIQFEFDR